MGVFEMHNAKNCAFLVRCAERAYLCTKGATKSVFRCLVRVIHLCTESGIKTVFGYAVQYGCVCIAKCHEMCVFGAARKPTQSVFDT